MRIAALCSIFLAIAGSAGGQGPPFRGIEYVEVDPDSPYVHPPSEIVLPPDVGEYARGFVEELSQPDRIFVLYKHPADSKTSIGVYLHDARVPETDAGEALERAERDVRRELRASGDPHRRSHVRKGASRAEMDPRLSALPGQRVLFDLRDSGRRGYVYPKKQ